jgi:DNA transformation protein
MGEDDLKDLFAAIGPIAIRRMFGGKGLYADGRIFGLVAFDTIYLKTDVDSAERLRAVGSRPFTYQGKAKPVTITSYWSLPESALDDPEEAARWARSALAVAARVEKPARKPGRVQA